MDARHDGRGSADRTIKDGQTDRPVSLVAPTSDTVRVICVSGPHQEIGSTLPDGSGRLTVRDGAWAYCAAGRAEEPHTWAEITPRPLAAIRHSDQLATEIDR